MSHPVLEGFRRQLRRLNNTRLRMEALYDGDQIALQDILSVYESLFLRAVVGMERYCETLFFAILDGKITYSPRKAICKMSCLSSDVTKEILLQGEKYLEWLPYHYTADRVKMYIAKRGARETCGRPFFELTDGDKSQLKTIVTIRNAIAHSSPHSVREFRRTVIGNQALHDRDKTPAGYLRSKIGGPNSETRFEVYMGVLGSAAGAVLGRPK